MEDFIFTAEPEDYLLDDTVSEIKNAEYDILVDDGSDIDNVGDITDENVEADDYDPTDDIDEYDNISSYSTDDDYIEYEISEYDDIDDEEDLAEDISNILDNDESEWF